eukprot:Em0002g154a
MHLYGVFTSPSFGPVGSAVCVFNYATMDNVFQTSSFVVRDTSTLVFNSVTGAPVDCIKSQDFTGPGPQSHLQCHWPHLQEDRGGPDHWTGQYDL